MVDRRTSRQKREQRPVGLILAFNSSTGRLDRLESDEFCFGIVVFNPYSTVGLIEKLLRLWNFHYYYYYKQHLSALLTNSFTKWAAASSFQKIFSHQIDQ
ncbi:Neurabin-2 [Trichinella pseudospiralis]